MTWRAGLLAAVAVIGIVGAVVFRLRSNDAEAITPFHAPSAALESAGMCPWRTPKSDMQRFFPGADRYEQRLLILSDLRPEILRRLGPTQRMDANGIYYYKVYERERPRGTVMVQRTAGEYGALEYVAAVTPDGRMVGVRIQRLRETASTAAILTSPTWLGVFAGKPLDSPFRLGDDLPAVPVEARPTAQSLADSLRRLMTEYDVARHHGR